MILSYSYLNLWDKVMLYRKIPQGGAKYRSILKFSTWLLTTVLLSIITAAFKPSVKQVSGEQRTHRGRRL